MKYQTSYLTQTRIQCVDKYLNLKTAHYSHVPFMLYGEGNLKIKNMRLCDIICLIVCKVKSKPMNAFIFARNFIPYDEGAIFTKKVDNLVFKHLFKKSPIV